MQGSCSPFPLSSSSLLFLSSHFSLKPLLFDFLMKSYLICSEYLEPANYFKLLEVIKKDIRILIGEETLFILASCAVSFFSDIATIYALVPTWCGEEMTVKELFVMIRRRSRRPAITWSYTTLFNLRLLPVRAAMFAAVVVIVRDEFALLIGVGCLVALLSVSMYLYMDLFWKEGLVVAVLEEDCYGMGAIWKTGELMRGRKPEGFLLFLVLTVAGMLISGILGFEMGGVARTEEARLGLGLVTVGAACLEELLICVVFTVFYCECKKRHGEQVEIGREERAGYNLISSASSHVGKSIL